MRILDYTGFKTPSQYFEQTTSYERHFIQEAVKQYEEEKMEKNQNLLQALSKAIFGR